MINNHLKKNSIAGWRLMPERCLSLTSLWWSIHPQSVVWVKTMITSFWLKGLSLINHMEKRLRTCKCFVYVIFTFRESEHYSDTFQVSILLSINIQGISLWGICPVACRLCSSSPCLCTVVALLIPTVSHWGCSSGVVLSLDYVLYQILLFQHPEC